MGGHPELVNGDSWNGCMRFNWTHRHGALGGLGKKKEEERGFANSGNANYLPWESCSNDNAIFCTLLNVLLIGVRKDPRLFFAMFLVLLFPFLRSEGGCRRLYNKWRVEGDWVSMPQGGERSTMWKRGKWSMNKIQKKKIFLEERSMPSSPFLHAAGWNVGVTPGAPVAKLDCEAEARVDSGATREKEPRFWKTEESWCLILLTSRFHFLKSWVKNLPLGLIYYSWGITLPQS